MMGCVATVYGDDSFDAVTSWASGEEPLSSIRLHSLNCLRLRMLSCCTRFKKSSDLHLLPPAVRVQPVRRCRALRPAAGTVHSADGWRAVLEPVIARYRGSVKRLYFWGDAAVANPEIYEYLETEGIGYAIRLPPTGSCKTGLGTC